MPPMMLSVSCVWIPSHVAPAAMVSMDTTKIFPAMACRREPLRNNSATAPDARPTTPPQTLITKIGGTVLLLLLDWSAPVQLFRHLRHAEAMPFQDSIVLPKYLKFSTFPPLINSHRHRDSSPKNAGTRIS